MSRFPPSGSRPLHPSLEHPTTNPSAIAIGAASGCPWHLTALRAPESRPSWLPAFQSPAASNSGDHTGCVISAGTGVCLAMGGTPSRGGRWGHLIGDAGSKYWIGRTALEAAMRGYDGRRQLTALTEMFVADFENVEEAYMDLQADPNRVARIASYWSQVEMLSSTDRVAANILDKAAAHLSEAVQAGIRRVGLTGPTCPRVVALGEVFQSDRVLTRFTDYLTLQWPNFALTEPKGDNLEGAAAMLDLPKDHPFSNSLFISKK